MLRGKYFVSKDQELWHVIHGYNARGRRVAFVFTLRFVSTNDEGKRRNNEDKRNIVNIEDAVVWMAVALPLVVGVGTTCSLRHFDMYLEHFRGPGHNVGDTRELVYLDESSCRVSAFLEMFLSVLLLNFKSQTGTQNSLRSRKIQREKK